VVLNAFFNGAVDSLVPADRRMYPQAEPERHRALHVSALATGMADKAVSLFYEKVLHTDVSQFLARPLSLPRYGPRSTDWMLTAPAARHGTGSARRLAIATSPSPARCVTRWMPTPA
jgi:hypothetical protein